MPRKTSTKAILFDAVGTLIEPWPRVAEAYEAAGRACGSKLDEAEIAVRFREAFAANDAAEDGPDQAGYRTDEAHERDRWRRIVRAVFCDVAETETILTRLWEHFAQPESWRLYDDVAPAWSTLAAEGALLGVASNFDDRLHAVLAGLPPLDTCRTVFVSSEIGCRKPAREFFRRIEQRLGASPEEILLVGDSYVHDVEPALAAGWRALAIDREGQRRESGPSAALRSLAELAEHIAG